MHLLLLFAISAQVSALSLGFLLANYDHILFTILKSLAEQVIVVRSGIFPRAYIHHTLICHLYAFLNISQPVNMALLFIVAGNSRK
jgi:hypothetical protein